MPVNIRGADGVYREFGMPDRIVRIHFPTDKFSKSKPWFWWITPQTPYYFSFLVGKWGPGWVRRQTFGLIRILPADSQVEVPVPQVGFKTLEDAVRNGNPDVVWGRLNFTSDYFWNTIKNLHDGGDNSHGLDHKPPFDVIRGVPTNRTSTPNTVPIAKTITQAVNLWKADWLKTAGFWNTACAEIDVLSGFVAFPNTAFSLPLPTVENVSILEAELTPPESIYYGPVPPAFTHGQDTQTLFPQFFITPYSFTINIGQLDDKKWNMSVYPPLDSTIIGNGTASIISKDYGGYSQNIDFPTAGILLTGI
jgi:hypothetical protein